MKLENLTITNLHNMYVNKETTPYEVVSFLIEKIKKDKNNFMEEDLFSEALEIAKNLGEPEKDNVFWGIPFLVKDNISTKGCITSASTEILKNYVPPFDAEVVRRLKEKKAILLGKTTMDSLAMGGRGTNGHKGTTFNPYDKSKTRIVGGSSSGSAAAVAANLIPFALASDTGDSIRKPASFANIVGFKPTWGRISRYGLSAFAPSLDHVGYFSNSVTDAALLFNLLAGRDEKDPTSSQIEVENVVNNLTKPHSNYKIAVINGISNRLQNEDYRALFKESITRLEKNGYEVSFVDVPDYLLRAIFPTYFILSCAEASSNTACYDGINFGERGEGKTYEEVVSNARTNGFSYQVKQRILFGAYSLEKNNYEETYLSAQKARNKIVNAYNEIFKDYDFIYLPATPSFAPKIDVVNKDSDFTIIDNHLAVANLGGFPSITLPLGFVKDLPVGINITAKPFNEKALLNFAYFYEQNVSKVCKNVLKGEK
ncbi:MAG: amidase family protein [Bacilli bacterium]|jgi:aspartyl-tRNA(Asn)/glutamyl-tRNA(Gln) amidotransferase subunit A